MSPELRVLLGKEWRQLIRSKGAMISSLLLPLLLLSIIPLAQMLGISAGGPAGVNVPPGVKLPEALQRLQENPKLLPTLFLPLFVSTGAMVAPSVAATYTLVSERESRTIELLLSLPVRIGQVLWAKLLAILLLTGPLTLVLLAVDCVVGVRLGVLTLAHVPGLLALLIASLAYSTASALLITLVARDFRTSNNLNGLLFGPAMILTVGVMFSFPGTIAATWALTGIYGALSVACVWVALKVITFERLLR